uniref:VWFC domain-containing protein n=1 Tax=Heliothis virescens TaxID=7102 RepID=A0A2A4JYG7_HELVI
MFSLAAINVSALRKSTCAPPPVVDKCIECTCDDGIQTCRNVCDALGYRKKERECVSGEPIPEPDECNTCICFEGNIYCTHKQCNEKDEYEESQCTKDTGAILRPDSCNICSCADGHMRCTANECPITTIEPTLPAGTTGAPEYSKDIDKVDAYSNENERLNDDYSLITTPMDESKIISNPLQFGPSDQHNIIPVVPSRNTEGVANNKIQPSSLVQQNVPNANLVISEEYHQYAPIESRIIESEYSAEPTNDNLMISQIKSQVIQHLPQTELEANAALNNLNLFKTQDPDKNDIPSIHENNNFESSSLTTTPNQSNESLTQVVTEADPTTKVVVDKIDEQTGEQLDEQTTEPQNPQPGKRDSFDFPDDHYSLNHDPSLQMSHIQPRSTTFYPHNVHDRDPQSGFLINQVQDPTLLHHSYQSQIDPRPFPTLEKFSPSNKIIFYNANSPNIAHRPLKIHDFPHGKIFVHGPYLHRGEMALDQQNNEPLNIHHHHIQSLNAYPNIHSQPHIIAPLKQFLDPSEIQNEHNLGPFKDITQIPYPIRPTELTEKPITMYNNGRPFPSHQFMSNPNQHRLPQLLKGPKRPVSLFRYPLNSNPDPPRLGSSDAATEIQYLPRPSPLNNIPLKHPIFIHKEHYNKNRPDHRPEWLKYVSQKNPYPDDHFLNRFEGQIPGVPRPNVNIHQVEPLPFGAPYPFDPANVPTHKKVIFVPNPLGANPQQGNNPKSSVMIQYVVSDPSKGPVNLLKYPQIGENKYNVNKNALSLLVQPAVHGLHRPSIFDGQFNNIATTSSHLTSSPWIKIDDGKQQVIDPLLNEYHDMTWPLPENENNIIVEMKSSQTESLATTEQNQVELPLTDNPVNNIELQENKNVSSFADEPNTIQNEPALVSKTNAINPSLSSPDQVTNEVVSDEILKETTAPTEFTTSNINGSSVLTNGQRPEDKTSSKLDAPLLATRIERNYTVSILSNTDTTDKTVNSLENGTEESTTNNVEYSSSTPDELQTDSDVELRGQFNHNKETSTLHERFMSEDPVNNGDSGTKSPETHLVLEESNAKDPVAVIKLKETDSPVAGGTDDLGASLFKKVINSRLIYKQKDQTEECGEGTQWVRNCHGCFCKHGKATCFEIPDCVLRTFEEPMTCKPYSQFKMGSCYTCVCNGDGIAECDSTGCENQLGDTEKLGTVEKPNNPEDSTAVGPISKAKCGESNYPTCEPGTSWISIATTFLLAD